MKSLATLIKLQKTRVDEQRVLLARLRERLEAVERAIIEHELMQAREQIAVREKPHMAQTYGAFLRRVLKTARELEDERIVAAKAVDLARDRLAELFEEQKRYELAEAARLEEERREELLQETITLDEVGGVTHQRRKRRGGR